MQTIIIIDRAAGHFPKQSKENGCGSFRTTLSVEETVG
jgi:hypothetical protein